MTLKILFIITTVLGLIFGLGFYFLPTQLLAFHGLTGDVPHLHMAQNFGSALLALAVMSWMVKNAPDSIAKRAIILALFVYFTFGSISILRFNLTGIPNMNAWGDLAFHIPLAIGFGYFFFSNRDKVKE